MSSENKEPPVKGVLWMSWPDLYTLYFTGAPLHVTVPNEQKIQHSDGFDSVVVLQVLQVNLRTRLPRMIVIGTVLKPQTGQVYPGRDCFHESPPQLLDYKPLHYAKALSTH